MDYFYTVALLLLIVVGLCPSFVPAQDDDDEDPLGVRQKNQIGFSSDSVENGINVLGLRQLQDRLGQPTFVATASRVVRPDTIYRVSVSVLPESPDLTVKALITKGRHQISSATQIIDSGSSHHLLMKIPPSITDGNYRLKLEGYDPFRPLKTVFIKEAPLVFHPDFLSIVIQSNRKVYRNEMSVKFRVILIQMDLKPYADPVTIFVLDPQGFIMRRWPSRYPRNGIVNLQYQLPAFPSAGKWTIRVEAMAQTKNYFIFVERYYPSFFEVIPSAPPYVLDSEESYEAAVTTSFHPGRVAKGNITIRVLAKPINSSTSISDFRTILEEYPLWAHDFTYEVKLADIQRRVGVNNLAGWVIRVAIKLHDYFMGEDRLGFVETRIIRAELKFKFAGTKTAVFKPGMPFEGHVYILYDDDQALSTEKLENATLLLKPVVTTANGQLRPLPEIVVPRKGDYHPTLLYQHQQQPSRWQNEFSYWMENQAQDAEYHQFRTSGIYQFRFPVPKDASSMRITAYYKDEDGDQVSTEMRAVAFYSSRDFHAHVSTSTEQGAVGENAILHLRSNFGFQSFSYVVISKGVVIHGAQRNLLHATKSFTFSLPVATDMAPTFKLIVMVINPINELVADSVTIPVKSMNRYKMNVTMVQNRDHSKKTVQLVTRSHPGAFIGVSLSRSSNYIFQADNELTPSRMMLALYDLEPFNRSVHGITWSDRQGKKADRSQFFTGSNPAADTKRTFSLAGLLVFTDAKLSQHPESANCDKKLGYESCMVVGCFHTNQKCDGKTDCPDGSDEEDCPVPINDRMEFRMFRLNRFHDYYDWLDGDWAWYDIPMTDDGIEFHDRSVAATNEVWYINAFSFHAELGFTILDDVVEYEGSPPFYFSIESPSSIRRGETLGIRMLAINNLNQEVIALIILEGSDDYMFVETGPEGEVEHFKPSLVKGEKHHMVAVKPSSMFEVYMPISPQIEQGTITVKLRALSQIARQDFDVEIEILPEGVTMTETTSLMLDLKNRAHVLKFLDIPVEESPIIPYSKFRRYVFGSPKASVTLCGDVFGPIFPASPVSTESYLGRSLRGTEAHLFNLASTAWSLHYLRLTNQLQPEVLYRGLDEMNIQMADLMRLFNSQGSFKPHTNSKPSVWMTAWVVRILGQSQFQDWENHYFVDRKLLASCVRWILSFQSRDGTFDETPEYFFALDRRMAKNNSSSSGRVTRTAHVIIGLSKCSDSLEGNLKVDAATAKARAVNFLERVLSYLNDPYDVAIVTHALTLANSPAKETAFGKLFSLRRETDGMIYWSRKPVPTNKVIYENQRPFIQSRPPTDQDSVAVEATSYTLLVYLARDGIGDLQERVVNWLNTMRMVDGGFVSIFDSIVAMEALTEYAYRARLREITEMSVLVEASASPNANQLVKISSDNLASIHKLEIPNVWGHVNIIGRGAGQAVLQLKVQYGIDWEELRDKPTRPYFDLFVEETYSHFRNKSHITVDTCIRWLAVDESPTSGATTIEVEMPSGYGFVQSDANEQALKFVFLRDVLVASNKVIWLFDKVGPERLCFNYQIRRWFPVANMTMYRSAIAYESHSPEHFEMYIFNATPLYVLDICEVCGSFQCPYCPYFSSSPSLFTIFGFQQLFMYLILPFVFMIWVELKVII